MDFVRTSIYPKKLGRILFLLNNEENNFMDVGNLKVDDSEWNDIPAISNEI